MALHIAEGHDLFSSLESRSTMAQELSRHQVSIRSVAVRVRPLDAILTEAGAQSIEFISIDVEGHEMAVLGGLDLDRWMPDIVLIEDRSDLLVTEVEQHMRSYGYRRFYRSGGNDWYAKPGRVGVFFMLRMLAIGRAELRGLLKVWLPRAVLRYVLSNRRSILKR